MTISNSRRRAWLRAACVILAVLIYLNIWSVIAIQGLTDYGRYRQLGPGEPARAMGAEFRLVSLVQTTALVDSSSGSAQPPAVNAVWVVARVDVVRQDPNQSLFCNFQVLGPDRRIWSQSNTFVSRDLERRCTTSAEKGASMETGRSYPLEITFEIPERYVDQLAGVVVEDSAVDGARQVLTPPTD